MIKIISPDNGVALGTKFIDADTGEKVPFSVALDPPATLTFDGYVTLRASIGMIKYEGVAGKVEWQLLHPLTDKYEPVARICFRDGVEMFLQDDGKVIVVDAHA